MLPDLFEIAKRGLEFFDESAGTTKSRTFQLFSTVKRISVLKQAHIIVGNTVCD